MSAPPNIVPTQRERHGVAFLCRLLLLLLIVPFSQENAVAAIVSGQVIPATLPNGSPAGAMINVFAFGNAGDTIGQGSSTVTDAAGRFQFELGPGTWSIKLDHKVAAQRGILWPVVFSHIVEGAPATDLTLEVFQPSIEVDGRLVTDQDAPIPNVSFTCSTLFNEGGYDVLTSTDSNGEFKVLLFASEWRFSAFGLPQRLQRPATQSVDVTEKISLEFVAASGGPRLSISPETLPPGTAGESYTARLRAEGGSQPHVWKVADGSALPPNLEITEFGGEIRGTLTQSGAHRFTIEVSTFSGSVTGQHDFTLQVNEDETAPTIRSITPSSFATVRDNSVIAIHFSEPMQKIRPSPVVPEPYLLRWATGPRFSNTEISLTDLIVDWNESGDTLYLAHKTEFPIGRQEWTLNVSDLPLDPNLPPIPPFSDASGNELETDTSRSFSVSLPRRVIGEDGELLQTFRDVEQVWIVKNHTYDDTQPDTPFRLGTFSASIHLPEGTWSTVRSADVRVPTGEERAITYFGFEDAGNLLHYSSGPFSRMASLDQDYPYGAYSVTIDTFHDGLQSLELNVPEVSYPEKYTINHFCNTGSHETGTTYLLAFNNFIGEPSVDLTQLVINSSRAQKVVNLKETEGGIYETIVPGTQSKFVIPADTLEPAEDYYGYLRRIKIIDRNLNYSGVEVVSALMTTTEFELSTGNALPCPTHGTHIRFAPIIDEIMGEFRTAQGSEQLPEKAFVATESAQPAVLTLVGGSTLNLQPNTEGILDTESSAENGAILELKSGKVAARINEFDIAIGPIEIRTARARVFLSRGDFEIEHTEAENGVTVIKVVEGEAIIHSPDSTTGPRTVLAGTSVEVGKQPTISPSLSIERLANGALKLSWDDDGNDWALETTDSLSQIAVWSPLGAEVNRENNTFTSEIEPSAKSRFFRLQATLAN